MLQRNTSQKVYDKEPTSLLHVKEFDSMEEQLGRPEQSVRKRRVLNPLLPFVYATMGRLRVRTTRRRNLTLSGDPEVSHNSAAGGMHPAASVFSRFAPREGRRRPASRINSRRLSPSLSHFLAAIGRQGFPRPSSALAASGAGSRPILGTTPDGSGNGRIR